VQVTPLLIGMLVVGAALIGCEDRATPTTAPDALSGKLSLTGSSTVAPLAGEIAKRFEELHPDARVDVQTGGSSRGIADARRGTADIGMASRALKPDESEILEDLIVAAHRAAKEKAEEMAAEKTKELTAGLPLPPGFKLPF